ncbi:MAG: hypothetical protein JNM44_02500 [Chitinophagaceae bacterium]|nr:hypothetical protein [Chitinophagaceae bacterium]
MHLTQIKSDVFAATVNTICLAILLIYLDEGFSNLEWIKEIWNWLILFGYIALIFPTQYLISKYFFNSIKGKRKVVLVVLLGFPFTLFIFWLVFRKLTSI